MLFGDYTPQGTPPRPVRPSPPPPPPPQGNSAGVNPDVVNQLRKKLEEAAQQLRNREKELAKEQREKNQLVSVLKDVESAWGHYGGHHGGVDGISGIHRRKEMDMHGALQLVHPFDGSNPDELVPFLDSCNSALMNLPVDEHGRLLQTILGSKLKGSAHVQLLHKEIDSFDVLRRELEALYGKTQSLLGLHAEFHKMQQRNGENVSQYASRAEKITLDLVEGLQNHLSAELTSEDMKHGARLAILSLGKAGFEQGLRGQVQVLVRANNYKTLHEACLGAVELEKATNSGETRSLAVRSSARQSQGGARQSTGGRQSLPTGCFTCGQNGHQAKDCKSQRKSLPVSDRRSINAFSTVCKFCKSTGHDILNCRKLKKKLGVAENAELVLKENKNNTQKQVNKNVNEKKTSGTAGSANDDSLPVGSFQIFMMQPSEEEFQSENDDLVDIRRIEVESKEKRRMVAPAEPSATKNHLMISADELERPTMFLADSGAATSVVKIGKLKRGTTLRQGGRTLRGISGHNVGTLGKVDIYLKIGDQELGHAFYVVDDNFPCIGGILGEDFFQSQDLDVSVRPGKYVAVNGVKLRLLAPREPTFLKARHECLMWAITQQRHNGIVRKRELCPGVFLGECLTSPRDGRAIVCVMNTTDNDVFVDVPVITLAELPTAETVMLMRAGENGKEGQKAVRERLELLHQNLRISHLNNEERTSLLEILEEYNGIVQLPGDPPGMTNRMEHAIPTIPGTPAVNIRPHRLPHTQKEEVDRQVKEMLKNGVVRPSSSQWNAPLLVVPKKPDASGRVKLRVVVDFRRLNDITIGDSFPLPNITEILDQLGNAKYFSTLDLASGFHQIPVKEADKCKTAFSTPFGHYEFNRLPFGVKGGPATFQRLMNSVLAGIQGLRCFVYLDDIVIFGASLEEHNKRLREVFQRLKSANLKLQPDKCDFLRKEVLYLGHVITNDGIKADPGKIQAVKDFPKPDNAKKVMSFLGLAGYYRKFIENFSKIAKPLTELLKKEVAWKWEERQDIAFETLKEKLITAPILQYPRFDKPFILTTDASNTAIGAVLSQGEVGYDLPVAYASRTLSKAENNYSTTEKELLAIVWGVNHFRPYLYGRKFTIVTDHRPLKWLFNVKDPGSRLMHWRIKLEEYDYDVVYKPGKLNTNADALSRINVITRAQRRRAESTNEAETDVENDSVSYEVITPSEEDKQTILKEYHDTPIGGHPGVQRMYAKIKLLYNWKGLKTDVEKYVASCKKCQANKLGKTTKVPMQIGEAPETAFEQCAMDIVGPLPETNEKNKYILTFQDVLTKFSKAIAIPDQEANTVAKAFAEKIICEHGTPVKLLTDQGRNFTSDIFKNVCRLLRIKKIQTTAYHPQTNGALERSHRTLAEYLRSYIEEDQSDWDQWLPYAMFSFNTTPHTSTKHTPFELMYGRRANLPTAVKQPPQLTYSYDDYAQELRERLRASQQVAKEKLDSSKESAKKQYDKDAKEIEFQVGEKVLLKNEVVRRGRSKKLTQPWLGPYEITERNSDVNYTIRSGHKNKTTKVHVNRLRPFIGMFQVVPGKMTMENLDLATTEEMPRSKMRLSVWIANLLKIIILASMILPVGGEGYTIERFTHTPGMHFESIGKLYLSSRVWTIAATTDVTPWLQRADQAEMHYIVAQTLYSKTGEHGANFRMILQQRMERHLALRNIIHGILGKHEKTRRGLIDGLGSVAKSLFGTMDAEDAREIHERLNRLEGQQGNSFESTKKQIDIINSTIFQLQRTEEIVQRNEQILLNTTRQLSERMEARFNTTLIRDDMDEHFMIINAILEGILRDAEKIKQLLTDEKGKVLETGVLTEEHLVQILKKAKLPRGFSFPVEIEVKNMHLLERISSISAHAFGSKIVTLIEIPLVNSQIFHVYKSHGLPVKTTDEYHSYLEPVNELLVIHSATQQHIQMTKEQLNECKRIDGQYLCTEVMATQAIRRYSPCEVLLFINPSSKPENCVIKHVPLRQLTLIHLHLDNAWLYTAPKPEEITIKCGTTETREVVEKTGILHITDHCEVIAADFAIRGRKSSGIQLDLHMHPKMNLTLSENVDKQLTTGQMDFKNIHLSSVIRNVNELKGLQLELGLEKNRLENSTSAYLLEFISHPASILSSITMLALMISVIIFCCWCQRFIKLEER